MDAFIKLLTPESMGSKQAALVSTAFGLFRKHGYQRVSVEEICATAQVSKVTFYKHYAGKDELFLYIVRRLIEEFKDRVDAILESEMSLKRKFDETTILKQRLATLLGDELLRAMFSVPAAKSFMDEFTAASVAEFRGFMLSERDKGTLNPNLDIDVILALMVEFNGLYASGKLIGLFSSPEEMIRQVNELLVYGMLVRGEEG